MKLNFLYTRATIEVYRFIVWNGLWMSGLLNLKSSENTPYLLLNDSHRVPRPWHFSSGSNYIVLQTSHPTAGVAAAWLRQNVPGRLSSSCMCGTAGQWRNSTSTLYFWATAQILVGLCERMPSKSFFGWDIEFVTCQDLTCLMWGAQGLSDAAPLP